MATRVTGDTVGHWRAYLDYTTSQSDDKFYVQFSGGWQTVSWYYQLSNNLYTSSGWTENGTEHREGSRTDISVYETYTSTYEHKWWNWTGTSFNFTKAHSARYVKVWIYCEYSGSYSEARGSSQANSYTITIPAKTSYTISYDANGGSGAPSSQTKWYNETLALSDTVPTRTGYSFVGWATTSDGDVAYLSGAGYTANLAATLYAVWTPNAPTVAPTIGSAVRNSDTSATISWTYSETVPPVDTFYIERKANGAGSYTQIGTVSASGSGSYIDTSTQANSFYIYRVRCGNSGGYSPYSSDSDTIYNTPSSPSNLDAVFNSSLQVVLTWTQGGITENSVLIENSTDGSTWSTAATASGTNVTTYTDTNPPSGQVWYRVSNVASYGGTTLTSVPSNSVQVLTLAPPNAPTLISPSSGSVLDMPASVALQWKHNPTDGTSQTAAQCQYSTDGGTTWTDVSLTTAQSYTLATSSYSVNTAITWRVRTKGTYDGYGAWSPSRTFYLRQAPSAAITGPVSSDGGSISDVPVSVAFTYNDNSGSFGGASITVVGSGGAILYRNAAPEWTVSGSFVSFSIPVSDFLPANDQTYTLSLAISSTSGLSINATRVFVTDYDEPNPPSVTYDIDEDACSVTLNVAEGEGGSSIETEAVGLFRISADGELAIAAWMDSGDTVTDYLPPLDQEFTYRAVAYTVNGLTSQTLVPVTVDSKGRAMFNWGTGNTEYAGFDMDLTWNTSVDHKRALYEVAGLQDPVVRTTSRRTKTLSASGTVWWEDDAQLEALQSIPGRVWFREPKGHVVPVVLKVGLTYPKGIPTTSASISMTQVAKEDGE